MNLQPGAFLQGGKYRIEKTLGQGGFGITYQGLQVRLNREVAIKEFYMREFCNRNASNSQVSIGSEGSREKVEAYKKKFLKEAQTIAGLDNPHIVRIHDIFEENGTAYYVMEYIDGGSLSDKVKATGPMWESQALDYVRQIADALEYIHNRKILHLDVKPANILLRNNREIVLIDFGVSKHYDEAGGQTSSTPVGISKGYAPIEQYRGDGVSRFSPSTDIYSLGATFYFLLSGKCPPEATEVYDDGLPPLPLSVSKLTVKAIEQVMQPRQKDRPQSIGEFRKLLDDDISRGIPCVYGPPPIDEDTFIRENLAKSKKRKSWTMSILGALLGLVLVWVIKSLIVSEKHSYDPLSDYTESLVMPTDSIAVADSVASVTIPDNFVFVPSGILKTKEWNQSTNTDEHLEINVSDFYISKYEVTQKEYEAVMHNNPSKYKGDDVPVYGIAWMEAIEYCNRRSEQEGYDGCYVINGKKVELKENGNGYRLPTEYEHEYAARGGKNETFKYPGSDTLSEVAWWGPNSSGHPHPVGTKQPNSLGLYDLSGNASEWLWNDVQKDFRLIIYSDYGSWLRDSMKPGVAGYAYYNIFEPGEFANDGMRLVFVP